MKLAKLKKAAVGIENILIGVVSSIILFIITFRIIGGTAADITTAAGNISGSGLPLASLFGSSGVVLLVFMAGVLIALITRALKMHKG